MSEWTEVPAGELDAARLLKSQGLVELRFAAGRWESRSMSAPVPQVVEQPVLVEPPARTRPGVAATIDDIKKAPPIVPTADGRWLNQYRECDCGERFLVEDEHVAKSPRHRKWLAGSMEVELPRAVAEGAFPAHLATPPLEFGKVVICSRCKAKDKKGEAYYPDRDSKPENRYPCIRCNGHGVIPLLSQ